MVKYVTHLSAERIGRFNCGKSIMFENMIEILLKG
ncbi:hypothetical protein MIDIC_330014 [Alphaproteobacteria bacterium]